MYILEIDIIKNLISKFTNPFKLQLLLFPPPSLATNTFLQRKLWVSYNAYDFRLLRNKKHPLSALYRPIS